jgi:hypothetical protein
MYGPDRRAITTARLKAIETAGRGIVVFDRQEDPTEQRPLPSEHELHRRGAELLGRLRSRDTNAAPTATDLEALRALGYVR